MVCQCGECFCVSYVLTFLLINLLRSIVMIGTLTGLQWMIYDSFKIFMGFPSTGGGAPPAEKK